MQIDVLLKQIAQLQAQVALLKSSTTPANTPDRVCPLLTRNLAQGSIDEKINGPEHFKGQVSHLQMFLKQYFGLTDTSFVDGIFGPNTEKYVIQFQSRNGLDAVGMVGPKTRAKILSLCTNSSLPSSSAHTLSISFPQTITLYLGDTYTQPGNLAQGAFRIEYTDKNTSSIRITGRTISGIGTQTIKLTAGTSVTTNNWPAGLKITVNKINSDGSMEISLDIVSTD